MATHEANPRSTPHAARASDGTTETRDQSDEVTGGMTWRSLIDTGGMTGSAFASPILATVAGARQLVAQTRTDLAGVDPEDGEIAWRSPPTGDEYWSLVAGDDRILALANTRRLLLLAATPVEYTVIDERLISEDDTWAPLAVAGNQLFVREQFGLAAYTWR